MSSCADSLVVTRQEAQWMLHTSPLHMELLEKRSGVPQHKRGYTSEEFARLTRIGRSRSRSARTIL